MRHERPAERNDYADILVAPGRAVIFGMAAHRHNRSVFTGYASGESMETFKPGKSFSAIGQGPPFSFTLETPA
jgi:hypothetical protein